MTHLAKSPRKPLYSAHGRAYRNAPRYIEFPHAEDKRRGHLPTGHYLDYGSNDEVRVLENSLQKTSKTANNLTDSAKRLILSFISLQQIIRLLKDGVEIVQAIDNQMNALSMVTGANEAETAKMLKTYQDLATTLSSTTLEVAKSADVWLRQGRSIEETNSLIETSQVFSKVAFLESEQAAKLLTSAINGYQLSVEQAMSVVDKMTAVDAEAATGADDLAIALAETANSAKLAGVSLDAILAYIGTVSDVTQATAQTIGNSFSSMFARMQSVKLGSAMDEFGEDVSRVETVLKQYNITLRDTPTTFRNLEDVINDVAIAWEDWTTVQQREVATQIAGKQQMENFLVLMNNFSKATELQTVSLNSAGSALERFNIYQQSTAAKMSEFTNQWQIFWSKSLDSGMIKGFIEAGTGLVKVLDNLGSVLALAAGALLIFKRAAISTGAEKLVDTIKALYTRVIALIPGTKAHAAAQLTTNTAMQAGAISASALSAALGAVLVVIPLLVSAYNSYQQAQEEKRQRDIESANAAADLSDSLFTLIGTYNELSNAVELDEGAKSTLIQTQNELLETLGLENESVESLTEKYGSLTEAIRENAIEKLKNAKRDLIAGVSASEENVLKVASAGIVGNRNTINAAGEESLKAFEALEKASIIPRGSYGSGSGALVLMGDDSTIEGAIENYEKLDAALKVLEDTFTTTELSSNSLYQGIYDRYSEMRPRIEENKLAVDDLNGVLAREQVLISTLSKDLPNTKEEFNAFTQSIVAGAVSSGEFTGSVEEIESVIIDALEELPEFARFFATEIPQAAEDAKKSANDLYSEFATLRSGFEQGTTDSKDYTSSLRTQLAVIEELIKANPEMAKSYELVAEILRGAIETAPSTLSKLRDATIDVVNSAYLLSDAFKEQSENGNLSFDTTLKIIDAGYAAALSIDTETGAVTLNEDAYIALAKAKIEERQVSLSLSRSALVSQLGEEQTAVNSLTQAYEALGIEAINAALKAAKARHATTEADIKAQDVEIAFLNDLLKNTPKVTSGSYSKSSSKSSGGSGGSGAKSTVDTWLEEYKRFEKELDHIFAMGQISEVEYYRRKEELANKYLKGREKYLDEYRRIEVELYKFRLKQIESLRDAEIKAAEDAYSAQKKSAEDSYKAQKKAAEDTYNAQRKALENQRDLLNDQLNAYKKLIDYRKQLLSRESDSHDYEKEVDESNKRIAALQAQIEALSLDDSAKSAAKRLELTEHLNKETSDLEEKQYDQSVKHQQNALDDQYDNYKEHIDGQLKLLDGQLDALQESHDRTVDILESSHEAMLSRIELASDAFIRSIELKFDALVSEAQTAANEIARAFEYAYAKGQSSSSVMAAQQQLADGGYNVGKIDGIWGPTTEKAYITAYQQFLNSLGANLVEDGILGSKTRAAAQKYGIQLPSYHDGGIVGEDIGTNKKREIIELANLKPNEAVAKLENGETVLTSNQMKNLGGTISALEQIIFDPSKLAILSGGGQNANHLSAMTDAVKESARATEVNSTNTVVIEQNIEFNGVDLADGPKMEKFADTIVSRSEKAVFDTMAKFRQTGRGIPVTGRF